VICFLREIFGAYSVSPGPHFKISCSFGWCFVHHPTFISRALGDFSGIFEEVLRITPAGDGKSRLNGIFGRVNEALLTAVDSGMSIFDVDTILEALGYHGAGVMGSVFTSFTPDRSWRLYSRLVGKARLESVLRTELLPGGALRACKHSGYGHRFFSRQMTLYFLEKPPKDGGTKEQQCQIIDAKYPWELLERHVFHF